MGPDVRPGAGEVVSEAGSTSSMKTVPCCSGVSPPLLARDPATYATRGTTSATASSAFTSGVMQAPCRTFVDDT